MVETVLSPILQPIPHILPCLIRQDPITSALTPQVKNEDPDIAYTHTIAQVRGRRAYVARTVLLLMRVIGSGIRLAMPLKDLEIVAGCLVDALVYRRVQLLLGVGSPTIEDVMVVPHH
jgi:hypothetical protein